MHLYKAQDQASAPFLGSDNSRGANQDTLRGEILAVKQDRIGIVGLPGQVVLVHVRIENLTDRFIAATGNVIVSYAPRDGDQCHFRDLRALRFELMGHEAGEYHFAVIVPVGVDEFDRTDYLNDIDAYTNKPPPQPAQDLEEVADVTLYVEDGSPPARTLHRAPPGNWPRYEYPDVESAILGGRSQFLDRFSVTKLDLVQAAIASVRQITRDELRTVSEFAEGEKYIYDVALIYPSIASGPVSFTVMIEHHYRRPQGMTFGEKAFGIKPDAELYEVDSAAVTLEPGAIKHLMLLVDKHVGAKNVDVALYLGQYCGYEGEAGEYRDPTMRCVYKGRLKK